MRVAIAGYGVEGESNYRYWSADASNEVVIVDERSSLDNLPSPDAMTILGQGAFGRLEGFDLVVRTAGLSPKKISTQGKVWSATNEFFAKCPAHIIGVTGSKGKGTTASLIASILEEAGRKVWLIGNIGVPSLDVLAEVKAEDIVVYELSSFQLWDLEKSPQTAVLLHIEPEHLNVHEDMTDYVGAKANITRYQDGNSKLIYNDENSYAKDIASSSAAQKTPYPSDQAANIRDGFFCYGEEKLFSVEALKLKGEHNQKNALAAISAVWGFVQDSEIIKKGIEKFSGLPHRLLFVKEVEGVEYYDDSIATTPSSAVAALRSFGERHKVIILGGSSKGSDFSVLAEELMQHDSFALLIGEVASEIANELNKAGYNNYEILEDATMTKIVEKAKSYAVEQGVVLLSPAAASFGLFKDYADRGNQFINAVNEL